MSTTFLDLAIDAPYIKALKELGITKPTPIQEKAIAVLLKNSTDFIGLAQTGTGKTAAYGLPALHKVDKASNQIQILILAPTRELVQQVKKQLFKFTKYIDGKIYLESVYGGEKIEKQIAALKRPTQVVIATPGRLLDLVERGDINIRNIHTLILDEADEMLSMGFKQDLNKILRYTSGHRNTWLFSATMPEEIQRIVRTYMASDAPKINSSKQDIVNTNITHKYIQTTLAEKLDTLIDFLEKHPNQRGIIFCKTKLGAQDLSTKMQAEGFSVAALQGDMQQKEREKVMRAFKKENLQLLISTDVSARGIDVRGLDFVIHYQLPETLAYYTHRSGRTARGGNKGLSLAIILPNELVKIHEIQKQLDIRFSSFQ